MVNVSHLGHRRVTERLSFDLMCTPGALRSGGAAVSPYVHH